MGHTPADNPPEEPLVIGLTFAGTVGIAYGISKATVALLLRAVSPTNVRR